ncbi:hypothetical protein ACE6H2_013934 [Prunus campanulata]
MARLKKVLKSVLETGAKSLRIRKKMKKQEKSKKNPKQVEKLKSDIKTIGKDFKGKELLYCIDKTVTEYARYIRTQTNWKGEDITFHPKRSGRFEVIEVTREANFNPIEEYKWADEYSGRHSISNDGSRGSRYDGSVVRQVKKGTDDNFESICALKKGQTTRHVSTSSPKDLCSLNSKMARLKKVLKSVLEMAAKSLRIRKKVKKQEKSKKNPKQVEKLKKYVGYIRTQTNWKGEDITFHSNSSERFEVIEVTREANFNSIEEYKWADEYNGIHSIFNDGSSGSRYDGSVVRQVKKGTDDNFESIYVRKKKKVKKQEKSKKNPKQVEKLKSDIKTIGEDFKGKEPLYCIDKIVIECAGYIRTQTNWKDEDITFHSNSSGRFEVIEVTREANFNSIEEYKWADEYNGRHSISNDGSSGSRYDGCVVRQVKKGTDDNFESICASKKGQTTRHVQIQHLLPFIKPT